MKLTALYRFYSIGLLLSNLFACGMIQVASGDRHKNHDSDQISIPDQDKSGPKSAPETRSDESCVFGPSYADLVVQATSASGVLFGDPKRAVNGVRGGGINVGGTDVFSLDQSKDGILIVRWNHRRVCNSHGIDFNVFENSFLDRRSGQLFFEPVIVSVSNDGIRYQDFPHRYLGSNSVTDIVAQSNWQGFAGMHPVLYHEDKNNFSVQGVNPLDPSQSGGDGFKIDDLPDTEIGRDVKLNGFRYLKLSAAPAFGFPNITSAMGGFADIDGIYAAHFIKD